MSFSPGRGRTRGGYMEALLQTLRDEHGIASEETLAFIRAELIRSFKNGVGIGQERAAKGRVDESRARYKMKS